MGEGEEEYDEDADSDFEPAGEYFDRRLSSVETRLDEFITQYQLNTSMMHRLQAEMYRMSMGTPPPSYFYDPYDQNAPGSSHPLPQ